MKLYKLKDAATQLNISYPTLKQWIYKGKVQSIKTPGGHHRIPNSEIARLTDQLVSESTPTEASHSDHILEAISGRNKLLGTIMEVKFAGLFAQVKLDLGGQTITSIITSDACQALELKVGMSAFALVKATEVMLIKG